MKTIQQPHIPAEAEIDALLAPVGAALHAVFAAGEEPSGHVLAAIRLAAEAEAGRCRRHRGMRLLRRALSAAALFLAVTGAGLFTLQSEERAVAKPPAALETFIMLSREEASPGEEFDALSLSDSLLAYQGFDEPLLLF